MEPPPLVASATATSKASSSARPCLAAEPLNSSGSDSWSSQPRRRSRQQDRQRVLSRGRSSSCGATASAGTASPPAESDEDAVEAADEGHPRGLSPRANQAANKWSAYTTTDDEETQPRDEEAAPQEKPSGEGSVAWAPPPWRAPREGPHEARASAVVDDPTPPWGRPPPPWRDPSQGPRWLTLPPALRGTTSKAPQPPPAMRLPKNTPGPPTREQMDAMRPGA